MRSQFFLAFSWPPPPTLCLGSSFCHLLGLCKVHHTTEGNGRGGGWGYKAAGITAAIMIVGIREQKRLQAQCWNLRWQYLTWPQLLLWNLLFFYECLPWVYHALYSHFLFTYMCLHAGLHVFPLPSPYDYWMFHMYLPWGFHESFTYLNW